MTEVPIVIQPGELMSPVARALIEALNAELSVIYPEEGANHFRLDPDEVAPGRGAFLIAWRGEQAVGCGAVRRISDREGEIKRMYVVPEERGRQLGKSILAALEEQARQLGLARLLLETGSRQEAAVGLYRRAGFEFIDRYGEYVGSPLSVCMAKDLSHT